VTQRERLARELAARRRELKSMEGEVERMGDEVCSQALHPW
jgi:hypothetical protein